MPTETPARIDEARQFAMDAARLAADTRCHNVAVLDVRGISPVTNYFVIATGTSARQMRAVAEQVEELGAPRRFTPLSRSGYEGDNWILTDFVDVVLHVFAPEARSYYDLDGLWGDAPRVPWQETPRLTQP
jgi:ribosome-associated protein